MLACPRAISLSSASRELLKHTCAGGKCAPRTGGLRGSFSARGVQTLRKGKRFYVLGVGSCCVKFLAYLPRESRRKSAGMFGTYSTLTSHHSCTRDTHRHVYTCVLYEALSTNRKPPHTGPSLNVFAKAQFRLFFVLPNKPFLTREERHFSV